MKNLSLRNGPRPLTWRKHRKARSSCAFLLAFCLISYSFLPLAAVGQITVSGNIHPGAIEIDNSANVHPGDGNANIKNSGATLDWVKDNLANTDTPSLIDSIATGLDFAAPDQTAAPGGTGHWNGVRIVDGFGGGDQDIFLKGGKVNDEETWNIGAGTVGSSKFDATQMYIANNQTNIFFGMERNGNNGTTAFDFEFTQNPPISQYVPDRSDGDILVSFELQGSGNASGSVLTYIFEHNGTEYVPLCDDDPATTGTGQGACPAGLFTSINGIEPTPAEPWGYVDGGSWLLQPGFDLRMFAEAQVPLSLLPGVNTCGGSGFVQIRTRASSALGSDAKDTTKIFEYSFGGPTAVANITGSCDLPIAFSAAGSASSTGDTSDTNGLTYAWTFQRLDGADWVNVGSSTAKSGTFTPSVTPLAGRYRALLTVTQGTGCTDADTSNEVDARDALGATASKTAAARPLTGSADANFTVTMTGAAQNLFTGDAAPTFQWQKKTGTGSAETDYTNLVGKTASTLSFSLADLQDSTIGVLDLLTATVSSDSYAFQRYSFTGRVKITRTVNGLTCPANSPDVTVRGLKGIDP